MQPAKPLLTWPDLGKKQQKKKTNSELQLFYHNQTSSHAKTQRL